MACGILYKDAIVVTKVKKLEDSYTVDLPFQIYGLDCIQDGNMVTYSLDKHEGEEVMAKIDYKVEDEAKVQSFLGWLGDDPISQGKYSEHYPQVAEATLALTGKSLGTKVVLDGMGEPVVEEITPPPVGFCVALCLGNVDQSEVIS